MYRKTVSEMTTAPQRKQQPPPPPLPLPSHENWLVYDDDTWVFRFGWLLRIRFRNFNGKTTGSQNISTSALNDFQHSLHVCVFVCVNNQKTFIKGEKFAMAEKQNGNVICTNRKCERAKMFVEMIVYAKWMWSENVRNKISKRNGVDTTPSALA